MSRKVFISVLGASNYNNCRYANGEFTSDQTRFVQIATLQMHKATKWAKESRAFILLTEKAKEKNWENGLEKCLEDLNLPFSFEPIDIPEGKDEDEIWKIFETTYALLEEGDELYFDLTHSFRYLPMLILVLGNYTKFLKNAEIKGITYGNWEGRDQQSDVAPIVDLLPLSSLQDWTFAAANFLENGYIDSLAILSENKLKPLLRDDNTRTISIQNLNNLIRTLKDMALERITCRGLNVLNASKANIAASILDNMLSFKKVAITALFPIIEKMKNASPIAKSGDAYNMFYVAKWCYDHHLYQQAVTFLEEGIICFFCQRHGLDIKDKDMRGLVPIAFSIKTNININDETIDAKYRPFLNRILLDKYLLNKDFIKQVRNLINLRNDYNHCGMRESAINAKKIKDNTKILIEEITKLLFPTCQSSPTLFSRKRELFINLSNHPSSKWACHQKEAAEKIGEVYDIPFPPVPTDANETEIESMADDLVAVILDMAVNAKLTVHIMGEMTLTYAIVSRLKAMGIDCVASTTERIVKETDDGQKTSFFSFVGFRKY